MSGLNVKNTILQRLLQVIAPDLCYSCGKIGTVFCHDCKYDIIHETVSVCFSCGTPNPLGVCDVHGAYIDQVLMVGVYKGGLKRAIEGVKFHNDRFASDALSELLDIRAPDFPTDAVVVPVPTLRKNIRRRGYDQAWLIARGFAVRRGLPLRRIIVRTGTFTQHDTENRRDREAQVLNAFSINGDTPETVILVDDIITTGATVNEIARILREAGAQYVFVVAVAHPL